MGAGAIAASGLAKTNIIVEEKQQFPLSEEQEDFMRNYENWMDDFIEVIKERRTHPDDLEVNKRLMILSVESQAWQGKLTQFMEDENFARHYMIATERMTKEISA